MEFEKCLFCKQDLEYSYYSYTKRDEDAHPDLPLCWDCIGDLKKAFEDYDMKEVKG